MVFQGFSLCKAHHLKNIVLERQKKLRLQLTEGDYKKALSTPLNTKITDSLMEDYNKIFGDDNDN